MFGIYGKKTGCRRDLYLLQKMGLDEQMSKVVFVLNY